MRGLVGGNRGPILGDRGSLLGLGPLSAKANRETYEYADELELMIRVKNIQGIRNSD